MKRSIPFISEKHFARADDDGGAAKHRGRLIDEMLGTSADSCSHNLFTQSRAKPAKAPSPLPPARETLITAHLQQLHNPRVTWVSINNGEGLRISVSGCLDRQLYQEWSCLLATAEDEKLRHFEFNLAEVRVLGLNGLAMLLLFKHHIDSPRQITLCHCNNEICNLLDWSGMREYFVVQNPM